MKMEDCKKKLESLECPFNWKLEEIPDRLSTSDLIDKLAEKDEEISEPWAHLCIELTIAYLHYENKKYIKSKEILQVCDNLLKTDNDLVKKYKISFQSIFYSCRAILASKCSTVTEVKELMENIVQLSDLSELNKSAIFAIKANVFLEFGVNGTQSAISFAREALKLNPREGDWHFLMGKLLGRLRHFSREHMPTEAELSHLQTAQNLTQSARAAVFLANAYLEKSRTISIEARKNNRNVRGEVNGFSAEAKRLILLALEQNRGQDGHIMIRCAYGLTHLPHRDREVEKAKELLKEALKRSPLNAMANKLAGDLCMQEDKPLYDQALEHYKVAASRNVFSADLLIFEINVKLGKNPDPEEFYSRLLSQYKETNYQLQALIHACEFYMFIKRDTFKALYYFLEMLTIDPEYQGLKVRYVKYIKKDVNFYELMSNECRIAIENNLYKTSDEQKLLKNALLKIKEHNPKLMQQQIQSNLVEKIIDEAAIEERSRSGRGGRGGFRGRGGIGRGGFVRGGRRSVGNEEIRETESQRVGVRNTRGNLNQRGNKRGTNLESKNIRDRSKSRGRGATGNQNQINSSLANSLSQQLEKLQLNMNPFSHRGRQLKDPKPLPNMRCEGNDAEESIDNPYFIKYLEDRYRNRNHDQTFQEWLEKCSTSFHSPAYSTDGNMFKAESKVTKDVMEEISNKLLKMEMKAEDSRKNCQKIKSDDRHSSQGLKRYSSSFHSNSSGRSNSPSLHESTKFRPDEGRYLNKIRGGYSAEERTSQYDHREYQGNHRSVYADRRHFSADEYDKYSSKHGHPRERERLREKYNKYSSRHEGRSDSLDRGRTKASSCHSSRSGRREKSPSIRRSKIRSSKSSRESISPSSYPVYKRSSRHSSQERRYSENYNSRNELSLKGSYGKNRSSSRDRSSVSERSSSSSCDHYSDKEKKYLRNRYSAKDKYLQGSRRSHSRDSRISSASRNSYYDKHSEGHRNCSSRSNSRSRRGRSPRKIIDKTSSKRQRSYERDSSKELDIKTNRHRSKDKNRSTRQSSSPERIYPSERNRKLPSRRNSRSRSSSGDKYQKTSSPNRSSSRNENRSSRYSSHSRRSKDESLRDYQDYSHERKQGKLGHKNLSSSSRSTSRERHSKAFSKQSSVDRLNRHGPNSCSSKGLHDEFLEKSKSKDVKSSRISSPERSSSNEGSHHSFCDSYNKNKSSRENSAERKYASVEKYLGEYDRKNRNEQSGVIESANKHRGKNFRKHVTRNRSSSEESRLSSRSRQSRSNRPRDNFQESGYENKNLKSKLSSRDGSASREMNSRTRSRSSSQERKKKERSMRLNENSNSSQEREFDKGYNKKGYSKDGSRSRNKDVKSCAISACNEETKFSSNRGFDYSCSKNKLSRENSAERKHSSVEKHSKEYNKKDRMKQSGDCDLPNPKETDKNHKKDYCKSPEPRDRLSTSEERDSRQSSIGRYSKDRDIRRNRHSSLSSHDSRRLRDKSERDNSRDMDYENKKLISKRSSRNRSASRERYSKASNRRRKEKGRNSSESECSSLVSENGKGYDEKSDRSYSKKTSRDKFSKSSRHSSPSRMPINNENKGHKVSTHSVEKIRKSSRENSSERRSASENKYLGDYNFKGKPHQDRFPSTSTEFSSKLVEEKHKKHSTKPGSGVGSRSSSRCSSGNRGTTQDDLEYKSSRLSPVD